MFFFHIGNLYGSVPVDHSTTLKEKYGEIKFVLEKNFIQTAPMDLMCRFENGWVSPWVTRWLHKISLLLVFVGQLGKNRALDKKRLACAQ